MNCMKYHKKKTSRPTKAAQKLLQDTFTELSADAVMNGWGKAISNLHKKTENLHMKNYITDTIEETTEDAMFVNDTLEDTTVCPYCGSTHTDSEYVSDLEDRHTCIECRGEYHIHWDSRSWEEGEGDLDGEFTVVEDITDRHNKSLLVEVRR